MIWSLQVVFITGASSGIGRALALELGGRGATLGLLARRAETLRELVGEIEARGGRAVALAADVRNGEAVKNAAGWWRLTGAWMCSWQTRASGRTPTAKV